MARAARLEHLPPALEAGITQAAAAAAALLPLAAGLDITLAQWAAVQAAVALRIAAFTAAPQWWSLIHVTFVPALVGAMQLKISPLVWGSAFVCLALCFGNTFRTEVPLFLTSARVRARLAELLAPNQRARFIDLGCGLGGVIAALKRARPECEFHGVELALMPFLVSRWRAGRMGCRVERRDLMAVDLASFDVVYAFLSPAPMAAVWAKARREMRPGSLFVSLAFPVPDVAPQEVIAVSGRARHSLYVWRM